MARVQGEKKVIQAVTIYTRVSDIAKRPDRRGGERAEGETSTKRQFERCKAYVESQGWGSATLTHYTDEGVSAFRTDRERPGWQKVIAAVEARETDVVLVFALDRAGRNIVKLMSFVEMCQKHGVAFASATQPIDTASTYGTIIVAVLAAVAQMESTIKRERTKSKHIEMAEQGRYAGAWRTFGYSRDMEQVSEEVHAIREGIERFLNGESLNSIARHWNEAGFRTTARTKSNPEGGLWNFTNVRRLFANPTLAGVRVHVGLDEDGRKRARSEGVEYRGAWKPIIARSTYRKVAARLAENAENSVKPVSDRYILTGLLRCAVPAPDKPDGMCGERLVGRPSRGLRRYACVRSGKHHLVITADPLEVHVGSLASLMLVKREKVRDPATLSIPLQAALDKVDERIRAWNINAATAGLPPDEIREGRAPLASERDRIVAELDRLAEEPVMDRLPLFRQDASGKYTEEWAAMIRTRVDHVDVRPVGRGRSRHSLTDKNLHKSLDERVAIHWRPGVVESPDHEGVNILSATFPMGSEDATTAPSP